jgi:hypothetical protein
MFTYNPFDGLDAYTSPGPIFVYEDSCQLYDQTSVFPRRHGISRSRSKDTATDRWLAERERPKHQSPLFYGSD